MMFKGPVCRLQWQRAVTATPAWFCPTVATETPQKQSVLGLSVLGYCREAYAKVKKTWKHSPDYHIPFLPIEPPQSNTLDLSSKASDSVWVENDLCAKSCSRTFQEVQCHIKLSSDTLWPLSPSVPCTVTFWSVCLVFRRYLQTNNKLYRNRRQMSCCFQCAFLCGYRSFIHTSSVSLDSPSVIFRCNWRPCVSVCGNKITIFPAGLKHAALSALRSSPLHKSVMVPGPDRRFCVCVPLNPIRQVLPSLRLLKLL